MVIKPLPRIACVLLAAGALVLAGCGGGYGEVIYEETIVIDPVGDVEVDNQTDISGSFEDMFAFDMAPAATGLWTGNLLPGVVFPGEVEFVGSFFEDFYDAEADLDLGTVTFFDIFVEEGLTTTFEVF